MNYIHFILSFINSLSLSLMQICVHLNANYSVLFGFFCSIYVVLFLQSIQEMGNTKARKLYEANLPDGFRRPQTDQYPSSSVHVYQKWSEGLSGISILVVCWGLSLPFSKCSLTVTTELWNSSSGINMRRGYTTARMWPVGAAYVSAHDVPVQEANSSTNCTVNL